MEERRRTKWCFLGVLALALAFGGCASGGGGGGTTPTTAVSGGGGNILAQGERPFRIPDNLFLIGTMNTADRSITRLDHAMRRRFAFLRLEPELSVLEDRWDALGLPAAGMLAAMTRINEAIGDPDFAVGISYFLGEGIAEHLEAVWRAEVEPYLEEYFLDQPDRMREFRWVRVKGELQRDWDSEEVE